MRQSGMHKIENLSIIIRVFFVLAKSALFQRLTPKCQEMAFFPKNPMMNSFVSQREGGLGEGRASWLVTFDVINPYTNKPTATRKREKKHGGRRSVPPPPKGSPPGK